MEWYGKTGQYRDSQLLQPEPLQTGSTMRNMSWGMVLREVTDIPILAAPRRRAIALLAVGERSCFRARLAQKILYGTG